MESFSKTSAGRKTVPIRRLLLPVMATLIFMMIGYLTVGLNMSGRIQTFAHELEEQTLKDVVHAQRNSLNLHYLSKSLQDLVYAGNPQRARTAYVNNWGLLTETVFGQHDETKALTQRLIDSLQKTWSLRQEYEARRNEVNVDFNAFHQDLLAAAGVAAGLSNASTNLLIDLRQPIVQHLDRELRTGGTSKCSTAPPGNFARPRTGRPTTRDGPPSFPTAKTCANCLARSGRSSTRSPLRAPNFSRRPPR